MVDMVAAKIKLNVISSKVIQERTVNIAHKKNKILYN